MRNRAVIACLSLLATLVVPERVLAQSTYGGVVGVVADGTAAVLPGAAVTLAEVETNLVRTTTADGRGSYEFLNLTPGRYRVSVELAGFHKQTTEPFSLTARQTLRIDATLQASAGGEEITVEGAAPLINTETPTVSDSNTNRELLELPFTFRAFSTSPVSTIAVLPEVQ